MTGVCSHSIGTRLSRRLALFTVLVLGLLSATLWLSISMMLKERNAHDLAVKSTLVAELLAIELRSGGEPAVQARLRMSAPMRSDARLEVWRANGILLYEDDAAPALAASTHLKTRSFAIQAPAGAAGNLQGRYTVDYTSDAEFGRRWVWILALVSLAAGAVVASGTEFQVRSALKPLHHLTAQTRGISPQHLDQRLSLADPAEELRPWIDQFNALMERLERAYAQLEGFNADVAHELRTPLTNLIGQTEVALSRERSTESLRDTLVSNLEEMQRLSAMVNDMLFLSHADRGAVARRGEPVSLAALARQVVEFHEAPLEEAGLVLRVDGDAVVPVDEPLFKRALSNLLGNATRFAERGSTVVVRIAPELAEQVQVVVENTGKAIEPQFLPQLFDRFFRADSSRCCPSEQHHGLGLAIVAAIARMHAGRTVAESEAGSTRVGFTLAAR